VESGPLMKSTVSQPTLFTGFCGMNLQHIRRAFRKHAIDKVKVGGFDVDGILRGKYISLDKFLSAAEHGLGFCDVIFGWIAPSMTREWEVRQFERAVTDWEMERYFESI
jgi:glutamine synthetase